MSAQLGIFIPARPDAHLYAGPQDAVGCLRGDMHSGLIARLRAADGVTLRDGLNFRRALIENDQVWVGDCCLSELDAFAWYCEVDRRRGSFDLEVLHTLARTTRVICPPAAFERALDKYSAHQTLRAAGLPVPDTVLFDHRVPERMHDVLERWGAALLKPRRGGWGKGVTLIDHPSRLRDLIGYLASVAPEREPGFFLERYYDNDVTRWTSVTVIDGEVMYGYRKRGTKLFDLGDGRVKVLDEHERGGDVDFVPVSEEQAELALRAASVLGLGLIGFDMIHTPHGPIIVDENTSPGNYAELYAQTGIDPAEKLAKWILREACGLAQV